MENSPRNVLSEGIPEISPIRSCPTFPTSLFFFTHSFFSNFHVSSSFLCRRKSQDQRSHTFPSPTSKLLNFPGWLSGELARPQRDWMGWIGVYRGKRTGYPRRPGLFSLVVWSPLSPFSLGYILPLFSLRLFIADKPLMCWYKPNRKLCQGHSIKVRPFMPG